MTVGELIRELQKSDQEAVVVIAQQHVVNGQLINVDICHPEFFSDDELRNPDGMLVIYPGSVY